MLDMYAYTRLLKLKTMGEVRDASLHAARRDEAAVRRARPDADPACRALGWAVHMPRPENVSGLSIPATTDKEPLPPAADYEAAYRAVRKKTGARERKGSHLAMHLFACASPAWLEESEDPAERRRRQNLLIKTAQEWAHETFGADALAAWRYDRDEAGSGVVDLIVVPVRDLRLGREKVGKPTVSTNRALEELCESVGVSLHAPARAMQTSWAAFAQARLDPRLKRGRPRIETHREHLPADVVREDYVERRRSAQAEAEAAVEAAAQAQADRARAETARDEVQADLARLAPARDKAKAAAESAQAELVELQPTLAEARQARADLPALRQEAAALRSELPTLRRDHDEARAERQAAIERRRRSVAWGRESERFASAATAEAERVTGWLDRLHGWLDKLAEGGSIWRSIVEAIGPPPEDPRRRQQDLDAPDADDPPSGPS